MTPLYLAVATLVLLAVWPELDTTLVRVVGPRARAAIAGRPRLLARLAGRLVPVPTLGGWLRFAAVILALAPLPVSASLVAADLDAGLALVLAAGVLALAAAVLDEPRLVLDRLPVLAVGGLTLGLGAVPVVARVAALNLSDVVIAQQGGFGNWFAWRDPFALVATGCWIATAACLRPPARGSQGDPAGPAVWTLLSSALGACLFFGGWWAVVPALDGAPAAQMTAKVVALAAVQTWLRGRLPHPDDPTAGEPPVRLLLLAALAGVAGSLAWLVLSGEVR